MDYSIEGILSAMHRARMESITRAVTLLIALCAFTPFSGGLRAQTQGGTLTFASQGSLAPNDTTIVETIILRDYVGESLKALQFRVISTDGVTLRSVERGADFSNSSEWHVSHVIIHGTNGIDTAKVVVFGLGNTMLPARAYTEVLTVRYDLVSFKGARLLLSNVLGGLASGENAYVVAGPPQTVLLKKK